MRFALILLGVLLSASLASAQEGDRVRLREVLPVLAGSPIGALDLGPAPPPGGRIVLTRADILRALRTAGQSADGLVLPRRTVVTREARTLSVEELTALAEAPIAAAVAPCNVESMTITAGVDVATGDLEVSAEANAPARSGWAPAQLLLRAGGRERRVPVRARVTCPAPVIRPGASVRLLVRVGPVEASAPGVARQPGRVGDIIRVQNNETRTTLRGRVVDAQTVEVLR